MDKYLIGALVANKATLGFHWIYEFLEYLEKNSLKKQSLLFQKQVEKGGIMICAKGLHYFVYPKWKIYHTRNDA